MAVTTLAKPGDFADQFSLMNTTTPDMIRYGVMPGGKIYRQRKGHDSIGGPGGAGTWVDTGLTIPDVSIIADL